MRAGDWNVADEVHRVKWDALNVFEPNERADEASWQSLAQRREQGAVLQHQQGGKSLGCSSMGTSWLEFSSSSWTGQYTKQKRFFSEMRSCWSLRIVLGLRKVGQEGSVECISGRVGSAVDSCVIKLRDGTTYSYGTFGVQIAVFWSRLFKGPGCCQIVVLAALLAGSLEMDIHESSKVFEVRKNH